MGGDLKESAKVKEVVIEACAIVCKVKEELHWLSKTARDILTVYQRGNTLDEDTIGLVLTSRSLGA
ncbi:hypothetical protein BT69DRAFT_1288664 [Atractiella rhizophila]|nr:hypothetical protein BT69DRAFT_1288664 [Atractiella rhizophila]